MSLGLIALKPFSVLKQKTRSGLNLRSSRDLKFSFTYIIIYIQLTKINGRYYRDVLLSQKLLPDIRQFSDVYVFQQDGAPAHRARETVEFLTRETPAFIPPALWPPNSPDINPVDYTVWSVMEEIVYRTNIQDVVQLRQRILEAWAQLDQRVIDAAIMQWRASSSVRSSRRWTL